MSVIDNDQANPGGFWELKGRAANVGFSGSFSLLMTQSLAELARSDKALWFCLRAQPKHEHIAATNLSRQMNLPCFSPRIRFRKATRRGAVWFVEAMFPGYLFAQFVYSNNHRQVQSLPGVRGLVRFGDYIATLDDATIEALRQHAGHEEIVTIDTSLKVGQSVQIAEGPLRGFEAVITQVLPAKERIRVLLELLGGKIEADVAAPDVIPIQG